MLALAKRPSLALDVNIVQDNLPIEIAPNLYIGSIHAAFNQEALISHKITHILNASRLPPSFPKNFTYLSVDVRDKEDANILSCIPASNIFIEAGVEAGGVLVHCFGGRSRSAAFIAAYLMCHCGWSYENTIEVIVTARPVASVNKGFEKQLRAYALTNFDIYATQQVLLRNRIKALHNIRALNESKGSHGVSWRERERERNGSKGPGGNKRSWADRESLSARGVSLGEEIEEGDEELDADEDIESEKGSFSEIDESGKTVSTGSPTEFVTEGQEAIPSLHVSKFDIDEEAMQLKRKSENKIKKGREVRVLGNMPPLTPKRSSVPYLDPKSPRCRLSRPGSSTVRVIPPLRGLERAVCCANCGEGLFCLANVLRVNAQAVPEEEKERERIRSFSGASPTLSRSGSFSSPTAPLRFTLPSQALSVEMGDLKMTIQDDRKAPLEVKSSKRDLKRDCEGEHKQERLQGSFGSHSPKGVSDQKPPPSVRGSAKKFDFGFERASSSITLSSPKAASSSSGNGYDQHVRDERDRARSLAAISDDHFDAMSAGEKERTQSKLKQWERERSGPMEIEELSSEHGRLRPPWGRSVSHDVQDSSEEMGQQRSWRNEGSARTAFPSRSHEDDVAEHDHQEEIRRRSHDDARPSLLMPASSCFPSSTGCLLNSWGSTDALRSKRPQSAEKRRWLARMSLLSSAGGGTSSVTPSSSGASTGCSGSSAEPRRMDSLSRVQQMAHDDEEAMHLAFGGTGSESSSSPTVSDVQYLYVEYLAWMDPDGRVLDPPYGPIDRRSDAYDRDRDREGDTDSDRDTGDIKCRHCFRVIGQWTWQPSRSQTLRGQLEAPVFMIMKSDVRQAEFSLDATPQSTPRPVDEPDDHERNGEESSESYLFGMDDHQVI